MRTSSHENRTSLGPAREIYIKQNKVLHLARQQLGMTLDELRQIARGIGEKPSISSLSLEQRRDLIELLIQAGANVENVMLPDAGPNLYLSRLEFWNKRFPWPRPGFASNEQLALIEDLWERFFEDHRPGRGLRGFVLRQAGIDSLSFLRAGEVKKIIIALKARRRKVWGR
jgi:hypothetical protein